MRGQVSLKKNAYGFGFKTGHSFVERKNEGWCGTPPVTLKDFQGTWAKHDSLIDINVPYWGGTAHYQWKIISLDNSFSHHRNGKTGISGIICELQILA